MTAPTDAELRATWHRLRPARSAMTYDEAMADALIRSVLLLAAKPHPPPPAIACTDTPEPRRTTGIDYKRRASGDIDE